MRLLKAPQYRLSSSQQKKSVILTSKMHIIITSSLLWSFLISVEMSKPHAMEDSFHVAKISNSTKVKSKCSLMHSSESPNSSTGNSQVTLLDSTTFIDHKQIKTFNETFAWVEHLNAILAQKVGNMNEPIFQSSNARGVRVGEWWSLELIYA